MGCEHSKEAAALTLVYPSAANDIDEDIMTVWEKFLRGDCDKWKELVESGGNKKKLTPSVYWYEVFRDAMERNISTQHPLISKELNSRPIKCMSRIMCSIMQYCFMNVIEKKKTR